MAEIEETIYTVTKRSLPHDCGMCGPSGMTEITVTDGIRTKTLRQAMCDNSDPLTPDSALEWFIYCEDDEPQNEV